MFYIPKWFIIKLTYNKEVVFMPIKCENELCIYCKNNKCILDAIQLNSMGICNECVQISIEKNQLNYLKRKLFENIEKQS